MENTADDTSIFKHSFQNNSVIWDRGVVKTVVWSTILIRFLNKYQLEKFNAMYFYCVGSRTPKFFQFQKLPCSTRY